LYADDIKLIGVIENEEDAFEIQKEIDSMQKWAKTWQMPFNYDKCKVMHFGKKNREQTYTIRVCGTSMESVYEKRYRITRKYTTQSHKTGTKVKKKGI
jgi:hypothetical protein